MDLVVFNAVISIIWNMFTLCYLLYRFTSIFSYLYGTAVFMRKAVGWGSVFVSKCYRAFSARSLLSTRSDPISKVRAYVFGSPDDRSEYIPLAMRDESLMTRPESLMTRPESLMTRPESLMTRPESLNSSCQCQRASKLDKPIQSDFESIDFQFEQIPVEQPTQEPKSLLGLDLSLEDLFAKVNFKEQKATNKEVVLSIHDLFQQHPSLYGTKVRESLSPPFQNFGHLVSMNSIKAEPQFVSQNVSLQD